MKRENIDLVINKLKKMLKKQMEQKNYDNALGIISTCAFVLYITNIYYVDQELEAVLCEIARDIGGEKFSKEDGRRDTIVFYDGFGLNSRGLIQNYLNALCKIKKVVYITYSECKERIPDIINILKEYNGISYYIDRNRYSKIKQFKQLKQIVDKVRPESFFFYSLPDDVVGTLLMYCYENKIKRYQINLTDHAFWLGAGCIDECIEFRNYGANISREYRGISEEKIEIIPFYPIVNYDKKFEGFPFKKEDNQKVIFSGGALYKTLGAGNKYYKMVEHILEENKNVIFWYAGSGDDTQIKKIVTKYPDRAYFTSERSDLFQVLEHCDIYLSTYPICGGLMFQYAALAGIVPVTLKDGKISDGFLLNQSDLNIEFNDEQGVYQEISKLLNDVSYAKERKLQMKQAVMPPEQFDSRVREVVSGKKSIIDFSHEDTVEFRNQYLERINKNDIDELLCRCSAAKIMFFNMPISYINGIIRVVVKRLLR